jgi:D-alanine-D-alanine ligase
MSRKKLAKPAVPLRVLMLMDKDLVPPDDVSGMTPEQIDPFKAELDVSVALRKLGHEVRMLGLHDDLGVIRSAIDDFHPDLAFNLLEGFANFHGFDQHVVAYLELIRQCYTGCNPRGMTLARDKALTKKIMQYHRIPAPAFAVFPRDRRIVRPKGLPFPLMVKSVNVEASIGIARASIVHDDDKLAERVKYIHESLGTYAIAEQYIPGRELYVGVMGNLRLRTFPVWELLFEKAPEDMPLIATNKAKFDAAYQKRWGITTRAAQDLDPRLQKQIPHLCKRIYRHLGLTGYARLDFRLTPEGQLYLLEANPNPQIAANEDFADSAEAAGVKYQPLIQQILNLGLSYRPELLS